ncbi:histidine kinase [Flavobacteriaceae bacterium S0825]|uniref:sensor histidine kinase n=1 Tax=Gaetbulibacter sp. S0825 TaxID=2720084 RepID=UPI001FCAE331|nr:histidine kinase [Gaetbulibacter sp. S0825]MCK0108007.1 histidine kinase [Flavobacteriaceae bacterium S0825]
MTIVNKNISQILVHILFWMLFVFVSLFVFSDYYWAQNPFLQYLFILVVIVYSNNFFLLPYFVKRKLYVLYIFVFVAISFLATQLYCNVFAQCGCSFMKCLSDYLWQTLVPLIFFSFIWMLYRFIAEQEDLEKVKKEHTEMELKFLKSQINPHVLFNNLNTIYSYSIENPKETPELILMLSDNLKHVLYESNSETISIEKELHFLDNYIKFQKIRTEGVKHINYNKNIDSEEYQIAPLMLITIIENAFKHSTLNSSIDISIIIKNGVLDFNCSNDYDSKKIDEDTFKIGLQNLEKRLELIYKDKYEFTITKNGMFKVVLKLKLK